MPADQQIIFAPDKNLGAYINKQTGRNMVLWNGACMVHEIFSLEKITKLKIRHPDAKVIAHPECEEAVLNVADFIGSTTGLLKFTKEDAANNLLWQQKRVFYTRCKKPTRIKHLFLLHRIIVVHVTIVRI